MLHLLIFVMGAAFGAMAGIIWLFFTVADASEDEFDAWMDADRGDWDGK